MFGRQRAGGADDPFGVLGLHQTASEAEILEARRRLAKQAHPDVGGSVESMQRINEAAELALRSLVGHAGQRRSAPEGGGSAGRPPSPRPSSVSPVRHDHPSFTIEALPAEAFEGLLIVAAWLGDLIADDPPYELEVALVDPVRGWCRLELMPDAGASTVSLAVAAEPGYPLPDLDRVRDLWIDGLNRLDWADLGDHGSEQLP